MQRAVRSLLMHTWAREIGLRNLQKGVKTVNATSAEKRLARKRSFPLYISPTPVFKENHPSESCFSIVNLGSDSVDTISSGWQSTMPSHKEYNILTDKRKDTKYFTILFYKMQEDILFGTSKSYACCSLVGWPTTNQVQWSETSAGQFEEIAWHARYLTFRVICV